jgi:sucrose phosphorylase
MTASHEAIRQRLTFLYGADAGQAAYDDLAARLEAFSSRRPAAAAVPLGDLVSERDVVLITYGDMVSEPDLLPLASLHAFLKATAQGLVSIVHILPFFPYSGDDGFSIIDYEQVDPRLGSWQEVRALADDFRLMADAVVNHVSRHSAWFRRYCAGDPALAQAFIAVEEGVDLSQVTRPRALPLLTEFQTSSGPRQVWTTFSADQVDVNATDPATLLRLIDVLLCYVQQGAQIVRLDAIAFLWKIIGTTCLHLKQTHRVVQLMRSVLDAVAPEVLLISETNVPHKENVSYFGDGYNEAQLVYQFPLPPLTLHSLSRGDATHLTAWAQGLGLPSAQTTFYNFTASHDGIGVRPLEGILPPEEVFWLAQQVEARGGRVSYRSNPDGSQSPYELNISYLDAVSNPNADEPQDKQVRRFICSQAIPLALQGAPAVYFHSLFGSRNWNEGVERTGRNRSINREKLDRATLEAELADATSLRAAVFAAYGHLIGVRGQEPGFHPLAAQQVVALDPRVFALWRIPPASGPRKGAALLCLHNVTDATVALQIDLSGTPMADSGAVLDIVSGKRMNVAAGALSLSLDPYAVCWLKEAS